MAGYNGYSMSNNAVAAYDEGKKPLSKIKLSDLRDAGWELSLGFAKWLTKREGNSGYYSRVWESSEWHHTSKEYNCTDFYDPAELVESWQDMTEERQASLLAEFKATKQQAKSESIRVKGTYIEWTGTRSRPKANEVEFTGTLDGNWIHLDKGGKKKADGNHITWEKIQNGI